MELMTTLIITMIIMETMTMIMIFRGVWGKRSKTKERSTIKHSGVSYSRQSQQKGNKRSKGGNRKAGRKGRRKTKREKNHKNKHGQRSSEKKRKTSRKNQKRRKKIERNISN